MAEGLVGLLSGPLGDQKLIYDVMASGGAAAMPDLMLTSSVEGSLDDDYLVRNQEPVFGDPGRDALLLGRMQSLTCDTNSRPISDLSSQHTEYQSTPEVFSGVPLGLSPSLMVLEPINRQLNLCGNNMASPFEYPEVKIEDSLDVCTAGTPPRDLLVNLSMSMSMSMSFGFPSRLSSKFSMDDFPVTDVPVPSYQHESCLMPVLREPMLAPIKPKIEDDHVLTSFPHDFAVATHVAPAPPHGSPTTPELSSIGQASETDIWEYEQYGGSPPQNLELKETRKTTRTRRDAPKAASAPRGGGRSKGVTMCLRTLLRQLLAGTGWIMDSSMSKDHATRLIRELIGPELDRECHIQLTPDEAEGLTSEQKEFHYSQLLAELASKYISTTISYDLSQQLIKRDKGPYHLTQQFIDLLEDRPWPPCMIPEKQLRSYGCYRQGEASKRGKLPSVAPDH